MSGSPAEDSPSELESIAFESTPRPPTPPRESPRSLNRNKASLRGREALSPIGRSSSPIVPSREISPPASSAESVASGRAKSVKWSPWTTYHKPETHSTPATKKLPPSAASDPKSLKSILKPYYLTSPTPAANQAVAPHTHASFASMLESVTHALASGERSTKLDTYIAFCNTLKAYDRIPDQDDLAQRIPAILEFIKADIQAKLDDDGSPDSQLCQQSLKLLTIICWHHQLAAMVDDQNAAYFVRHAIDKVEDTQTSKYSVNLYLHFLASQRMLARGFTPEKVNRLITALGNLDQRVTGKSISKERVDVYNKLLQVSSPAMLTRAADWMDHALGGLLNGVREVRHRSLALMGEVAKHLGGQPQIRRAITEILNRPVQNGRMFEQIRQRLEHFVHQDKEGAYVARVWSHILLCTRNGGKWEFFQPWLRLIEACFNVSEKAVKVEAQQQWTKLIYILSVTNPPLKTNLELLCKPIEQYLDPKRYESNTAPPRKAAVANVSALLYYGLRPNSTPATLLEYWQVVVVGLIDKNAFRSKEEVIDGVEILCSIFDGKARQKPWSDVRALQLNAPVKPEEIPRLDPRWVRSHCELVLKTVEHALWQTSWREDSAFGAQQLWKRFVQCLADAGSKEIKVSAELMECISHLFNFFQRVWNTGASILDQVPEEGSISFIKMFAFLVLTSLNSLGTFCFTEKQLSYDEDSKFSHASTPTRNQAESNSALQYPPILHIFRLFTTPPSDIVLNSEYYECAEGIFSKCVATLDSRRKRLQLLASFEGLLPRRDPKAVDLQLWAIIAKILRSSLSPPALRGHPSPSPAGSELREVGSVLRWGCCYDVSGWEELFNDICKTAQSEIGDAFTAVNVIEVVAEALRYSKPDTDLALLLGRTIALFNKASLPRARPKAENTIRAHFSVIERKGAGSESLENLYPLADDLLRRSYNAASGEDTLGLAMQLISTIANFITRSSSGTLIALKQIQDGLGLWIRDSLHILSSKKGARNSGLSSTWPKLIQTLEALPKYDSVTLSGLSPLLASGFESRWKGIVNATIKQWNSTFGKQKSLSYPQQLRTALRRLKSISDISLPDFPEDNDDDRILTPPEFEESQEHDETSADHIFSSPTPGPRRPASLGVRSQASPILSPGGSPAEKEKSFVLRTSPRLSPRGSPGVLFALRSSRRSTTPAVRTLSKPKHMDSQIDFVPIDNSQPAFEVQDSQLMTEHQREVRQKQADEANAFLELSGGGTPTRRSKRKVGTPRPSVVIKRNLKTPNPPSDERPMVAETVLKPAKVPDLTVSFVAESSMDEGILPGSEMPSLLPSADISREERPTEPAVPPSDGMDLVMSDLAGPEDRRPPAPQIDLPQEPPSDALSIEHFVDAPDEPIRDSLENVDLIHAEHSPLLDIADLVGADAEAPASIESDDAAAEIPAPVEPAIEPLPVREEACQVHDCDLDGQRERSPDVRAPVGTPQKLKPRPSGILRGKKRKRSSVAPQTTGSSEMLDVIIIGQSQSQSRPQPQPQPQPQPAEVRKPAPPEPEEPPAKRLKAKKRASLSAAGHSAPIEPEKVKTTRVTRLSQSFVQETQVGEVEVQEVQEVQRAQESPVRSRVSRHSARKTRQTLETAPETLTPTKLQGGDRKGRKSAKKEKRGQEKKATEEEEDKVGKGLQMLRQALDILEGAEMTKEESMGAEDAVFEAFSRLRERRKR